MAAHAGATDVPWSQFLKPVPALVLSAFLRALCSVILTPSSCASLLPDWADYEFSPETDVFFWLLPGSHLSLDAHQILHSVCWELAQLCLSSIFQEGQQFRGSRVTQ